jgi:DNA-binding NtrC family response regulator
VLLFCAVSDARTVPHRTVGLPLRGLLVEVLSGPDRGKRHAARSDVLTIGTSEGNDLVLSDETVSRYHLELQQRGDRIRVQDNGSTNGTAIAGAFIERGTIAPGALLKLGRTTIKVEDGELVTVDMFERDTLGPLRGRSPAMRRLMARIQQAAETNISVLLLGETGTGKELIAHALHASGPRAGGPFETVDCAALAPNLVASELFGHERGAFTGADRRHVGAFERADGGTLFLDEIGELPSGLQPSLLGALERRSFRRLGGSQSISVDVRLVAATHRDLRAEVNAGSFRQDLYYRIAVLLIAIPPLREREGDIPLLAEHFLRQAGHEGPVQEVLPGETLRSMMQHRWPGNVRELRNFVEAAMTVGEPPPIDRGEDLADLPAEALSLLSRLPYKDARNRLLDQFEAHYLRELLERAGGNVSKAARDAQMSRQHLMDLLKRSGPR